MNLSLGNISTSIYYIAPYLALLLMFALDNIYLPWSAVSDIRPGFVLMAIYYWAIYRPALLPPLLIFVLALAMDVTSGTALGLHCLIYLPLFLFLRSQRRFLYEQPFFVVWLGFLGITAAVNIVSWFLIRVSAYSFDFTLNNDVVMAIAYDIAGGLFLFPVVAFLLFFIHRLLPNRALRSGEIK